MNSSISATNAFLAVMRRDLHIYLSYRTRLVSQVLTALFSLTLFYYVSRLVHVTGFGLPQRLFRLRGRRHISHQRALLMLLDTGTGAPRAGGWHLRSSTALPFWRCAQCARNDAVPNDAVLRNCRDYPWPGLRGVWTPSPLVDGARGTSRDGARIARVPTIRNTVCGSHRSDQAGKCRHELGGSTAVDNWRALFSRVAPASLAANRGQAQPFTAATDLLRHLLVNSSLGEAPVGSLLKLVAFAAVLLPLSVFMLTRAIRSGQRRGTIIEY